MRQLSRRLLLAVIGLFSTGALFPQQVNTLYFMQNVPVRHVLNPAFIPDAGMYVSLPLMGYVQFDMGNNSFAFNDLVYHEGDKTITFLDSPASIRRFYNTLKPTTVLRANFRTSIISAGFRWGGCFWNFSVDSRFQGMVGLPRDAFRVSLFGTTEGFDNRFDFAALQSDLTCYTQFVLGMAKQLDSRLTCGVKLKYLAGSANISSRNKDLSMNGGDGKWKFSGVGSINESSPVAFDFPGFQSFSYELPDGFTGLLKPSGAGAGIDVGVDYRMNGRVGLSAALTDLGFIHWHRNPRNISYNSSFVFGGISPFTDTARTETLNGIYDALIVGNILVDSILGQFDKSMHVSGASRSYYTSTTSTVNLGVEYHLFPGKLSLGVLTRVHAYKKTITGEVTASVNARPFKWLGSSLGYSFLNGNLNTVGAGFSLGMGCVNCFLAADYLFFEKVDFPLSTIHPSFPGMKVPIPYRSNVLNLSAGVNILLGLPGSYGPGRTSRNGLHRPAGPRNCRCDWD
ncbi:MAG TPA: DUF5723 family protein [Paludibacter sp.]|nr:DUF5723 family protein [Paludibacter sp.]